MTSKGENFRQPMVPSPTSKATFLSSSRSSAVRARLESSRTRSTEYTRSAMRASRAVRKPLPVPISRTLSAGLGWTMER